MILAIVGLAGSGKTEATKFFMDRNFSKIYFGDVTFEQMKKEGLQINEANERITREKIRKEHGMAAYAILNFPKISKLALDGKDVLIESMYSFEEYLYLKEKFSNDFYVLAIHSSFKTRAKRLKNRKDRPLSKKDLESRDKSQIENLHQAGPIALAEFMIVNEGTQKKMQRELNKVYTKLSRLRKKTD